jgi:hypothetical protein
MFGFSFINCKNFRGFNPEIAVTPFKAVEISGGILANEQTMNSPLFTQAERIHLRRLVESPVTRTITEHSEKIKQSFINHFSNIIQISRSDITSTTFDFGIEQSLSNPQLRAQLIHFIKRLAPAIIPAPFTILLPVRVPFHAGENSTGQANFLRDLVVSNIAFSLDIHPHELAGHQFDPASFLRLLRFDIGLIRFIYEPATGNRLVEKVLSPWLDYLVQIDYRGDIIFCPASGDHEIFEHEYANLAQLCAKL